MKQSTLIKMTVFLLILIATMSFAQAQTGASSSGRTTPGDRVSAPPGNEAENLPALLKELSVEIRKLRVELHKLQLDNHEEKIAQLERELQQVQTDQRQLQEQEQAFNQEIAELDRRSGQSTPAEGQVGLEAAKAELLRNEVERSRAEQQKIAQREAELTKLLGREQRRWQELVERGKQLRVEGSEQQRSHR